MIKRVIIIGTLSLLGTISSLWLGYVWTNSVLSNFTFSDHYGLNTLAMVIWLPTIVVFLVIGALLKRLFRETGNYGWPFCLGLVSALFWLSLTKTSFVDEPSVADVLWVYSEPVMPLVACMLGWLIAKTVSNRSR